LVGCEDLWIEVNLCQSEGSYLLAIIYRHPHNNTHLFIKSLNHKSSLITNKRK